MWAALLDTEVCLTAVLICEGVWLILHSVTRWWNLTIDAPTDPDKWNWRWSKACWVESGEWSSRCSSNSKPSISFIQPDINNRVIYWYFSFLEMTENCVCVLLDFFTLQQCWKVIILKYLLRYLYFTWVSRFYATLYFYIYLTTLVALQIRNFNIKYKPTNKWWCVVMNLAALKMSISDAHTWIMGCFLFISVWILVLVWDLLIRLIICDHQSFLYFTLSVLYSLPPPPPPPLFIKKRKERGRRRMETKCFQSVWWHDAEYNIYIYIYIYIYSETFVNS